MISGELLQSLSEVSLYTEMTDLIAGQIKHLPQNLVKISDASVESIKQYKTVFVYTHCLQEFFEKVYLHLQDDVILISHNSDLGVHNEWHRYLDGPKIKKWFCQNKESQHPKLFSLPIGLANSQWPHGNQQAIHQIRNQNKSKDFLVFKNFDINTNRHERLVCDKITNDHGIKMSPQMAVVDYWDAMSRSVFTISPPGNGIDCHRIWEALYLGCVPIVKYHEAFSQFRHLPIMFVDSWEQCTIDNLSNKSKQYTDRNYIEYIPELELEFWREKITND